MERYVTWMSSLNELEIEVFHELLYYFSCYLNVYGLRPNEELPSARPCVQTKMNPNTAITPAHNVCMDTTPLLSAAPSSEVRNEYAPEDALEPVVLEEDEEPGGAPK